MGDVGLMKVLRSVRISSSVFSSWDTCRTECRSANRRPRAFAIHECTRSACLTPPRLSD